MVDKTPPSSTARDADSLDASLLRTKPNAARRSPQDKKRQSYDKDRRNAYGESDKGSRKTIPRHKRQVNKANRRHDRQILLLSTGIRQSDDITDERLHRRRRKRWRKSPDETLRQAVERRLKRRQRDRPPGDN